MRLINADCLKILPFHTFDCIFADPPDNIGLGYHGTQDNLPAGDYVELLEKWLRAFIYSADTTWFSFNAKWTFKVGTIVDKLLSQYPELRAKACQQVFTFGQHNRHDLATTTDHCTGCAGQPLTSILMQCGCRPGGSLTATSGLIRGVEFLAMFSTCPG